MQRIGAIVSLLVVLLSGCNGSPSVEPAQAPVPKLLEPYQGDWRFDPKKTLALWKSEGMSDKEISQVVAMSRTFPIHPDMTIASNLGVLAGSPEGEYFFFELHEHDRWVCGKAWHHEDRHDPGDMSKCYARLAVTDLELRLSLRRTERDDPNDPDVTHMRVTHGSLSDCRADSAPAPTWGPWTTYIFVRK
jgi:hypothetical protein